VPAASRGREHGPQSLPGERRPEQQQAQRDERHGPVGAVPRRQVDDEDPGADGIGAREVLAARPTTRLVGALMASGSAEIVQALTQA
jgi:hypothetical protein